MNGNETRCKIAGCGGLVVSRREFCSERHDYVIQPDGVVELATSTRAPTKAPTIVIPPSEVEPSTLPNWTPPPRIKWPFGKHKGEFIDDLPDDYIDWALENMDRLSPNLRSELENQKIARSGGGISRGRIQR